MSSRQAAQGGAPGSDTAERWWEAAFTADYLSVYAHRDDAEAARLVELLLPLIGGGQGIVLDVGCGGGRHLERLRAVGLPAYGVDLSRDLLAAARARPGLPGRLARADMRAVPIAPGSCRAVLLLFTVFGYFDDAAHLALLAHLRGLLTPGGAIVLDLPDAAEVRRTLVAESERGLPAGGTLRERRWIAGDRVCKTVQACGRRWSESVRLYDVGEIAGMAQTCGLRAAAVRHGGRWLHALRPAG